MFQSKQKGFTLVEIAIVLVIVGLLIGGVLKGQEMITNAKLKRIESDNYETLIQARDKGKRIKILGIEEGDVIKKVFAQVKSDEYNVYFFLTGKIYLEDLSALDIEGIMNGIDVD